MDSLDYHRLKQTGVIPRGLNPMEEMEIIRGLRRAASTTATEEVAGLPEKPSVAAEPEPARAAAKPAGEPKIPKVAPSGPVIDCSAEPSIPDGWDIRPGDQIASSFRESLVWTPDAVRLHLEPEQKNGGFIDGNELKKRLKGQEVLPANVLDWLYEKPEEIPDEWKGKLVWFWGTVYRDRLRGPVVRCLNWFGGRWYWGCLWLDHGWGGGGPAAVPAGVFQP